MKTLIKLTALCFAFTLAVAPIAVHAQDKAPAKSEKASTKSQNAAKDEKANKPAAKVDINAASAATLAKLPGLNAEIANKIIAGRPYDNKAQLKSKNVITEAQYEKIADQIIAKQPKKDDDTPKSNGQAKGKDKSKDKAAK